MSLSKHILRAKGFIFDLDGTLIDTTPLVEQFWRQFALENDLDAEKVLLFFFLKEKKKASFLFPISLLFLFLFFFWWGWNCHCQFIYIGNIPRTYIYIYKTKL